MKLIELVSNKWTIRVIISKEKNIFDQFGLKIRPELLHEGVNKDVDLIDVSEIDDISNLKPKELKQFEFWNELLELISNEPSGPMSLEKSMCHEIDKKNNIYQIGKTNGVRLVYFVVGTKVMVCSHSFDKGTTKTPKKDKRIAIKARKEYLEAQEMRPDLFK